MNAIHHIAFHCRDRLALERFYTKHLGFQRARVFNAGTENEFVMLRLGACCIEFFASAHPEAETADPAVGVKHLAYETGDLDAVLASMKADGVEPGPIMEDVGVEGMRICFLQDPEGNTIELMEGWKDQENPPPLH